MKKNSKQYAFAGKTADAQPSGETVAGLPHQ